ncbi:MAG TPA: radical SAM protein [Bacteroidia bacterium]|nr:radical SAM protein [Bacteroidia bacterium]
MPRELTVKSILNKTRRRDPWFLDDYTLNPYSGCSFNCRYCYIRGSKYGNNLEIKTSVKTNAVELLDKQLALRAKKGQHGIIALSSATDPYLHFEEEYQLTRQLLQIILKHRFPVHIITKSPLVVRDFDVLKEIDKAAILPADLLGKVTGTVITFSFSTIDDAIAHIFEPGAPPPSERLKALEKAAQAGFKAGVSMMPLLPYITDTGQHLEEMYTAFKNVGARYVLPATITLFGEGQGDSKTLVFQAVEKHYPHLLPKYRKLFVQNSQLPAYYNKAFYNKAKELEEKYKIPLNILSSK